MRPWTDTGGHLSPFQTNIFEARLISGQLCKKSKLNSIYVTPNSEERTGWHFAIDTIRGLVLYVDQVVTHPYALFSRFQGLL